MRVESGWLAECVERLSRWGLRLDAAWERPRVERLALPSSVGTFVLGRARWSDCVLPDPTVSRCHAWLRHGDEGWRLRDLASSNGTWVNGRRVIEEVEVQPGDRVSFGAVTYRLTEPVAGGSGRHPASLSAGSSRCAPGTDPRGRALGLRSAPRR